MRYNTLWVIALAMSLLSTVFTSLPADAGNDVINHDAVEAIHKIVPEIAAESVDSTVSIPKQANDPISIGGGATLRVQAPAVQGDQVGGGFVAFGEIHTDTDLVMQATANGPRVLHVINSADAPTAFDYDIDLPAGSAIEINNGAVDVVDQQGEVVGRIAPPWAFDADQNRIPSAYQYDAASQQLTLQVDHTTATAYPVVADPWVPAWIVWHCGIGFAVGWATTGWHNVSWWTAVRNGAWGCIGALLLRFY